MLNRSSVARLWRVLAAFLMILGLVVAGTEAGAADSRALMAPVGVWSGTGDNPADTNDYTIVAVMPGPVGSQRGFFGEYVAGACDLGQVAILGIAGFTDDGFVTISGDIVCMATGEVIGEDAVFPFKYDATADTLTGYMVDGNDWVPYGGYPAPFTRKCTGSGNTMTGTPGDDLLVGTSGHDVIDGLGGNDVIKGKGGMDILCGQGGRDKLVGGGDIDVLVGGGKKDRLNGGPGWDLLLGEGGPDILKGGGGSDSMFGGAGGDTLNGGPGRDYADGGGGADTCSAETQLSC